MTFRSLRDNFPPTVHVDFYQSRVLYRHRIVSSVGRKTSQPDDCLFDESSDGKLLPQSVQSWCKVLPPLNRLTSSLSAVIRPISSPPISLLKRASPSHNHLLWKPTRLQSDDTERGAPANGRNLIRDIKSIGGVFGTCTEPIHRARLCKRRRFASRASCSVRIKTRTVKKPFSLGSGREVAELAPRCLLVFSPDAGDLGVEEGGRSLIYGEDITHTHETVKRHARSQPWDHEKDILVATPLFN